VLVAIGVFLAGRAVAADAGVAGVAMAEWVGLVLVPLALLALRRRSLGPTLGLSPLPRGSMPASLLLGLGALPMAWFAFWIANVAAPVDPEAARVLGRELVARDGWDLLVLVALAAVTPAICEEFLFRGLLLRTLLRRHSPALAVGVSASTFALLHWTPAAAARVAPTFVLGLLLGWAVWRSRSLWVGMLVHGVYNSTLLAGAAWSVGPGPARPEAPPTAVLLLGFAMLFAGTHVLMLRTPTPHRS
jgi:sodium transport system permease protein